MKYKINEKFFEKSCQKIWWEMKKSVTLHRFNQAPPLKKPSENEAQSDDIPPQK